MSEKTVIEKIIEAMEEGKTKIAFKDSNTGETVYDKMPTRDSTPMQALLAALSACNMLQFDWYTMSFE